MEKKPIYESPKVSRLDEKKTVFGRCESGSGDAENCWPGNIPGVDCDAGNGERN